MVRALWQAIQKNWLGFALTWAVICGYIRVSSGRWPPLLDMLWGLAFSFAFTIALPYGLRAWPMYRQRSAGAALQSGTEQSGTGVENGNDLRATVERFIVSVDRADVAAVTTLYDPEFVCVRVADEGGFVRLTHEQMVDFLRRAATYDASSPKGHAVPTQETKIHHAEIIGKTGYVLMTRVKDLGDGWEPLFYTLIWKQRDGGWKLLREFVHQKTVPQWR